MMRSLGLGLAGIVFAVLGGCAVNSFSYGIARYGTAPAVNVVLRCRDTYEVLDRPDAGSLLVGTNPLNEVLAGCLDGGPDLLTRQRQVVRIFFEEKTERPFCRVTQVRDLTPTHREFLYRCPDDPKSSPRLQRAR